MRHGSRIAASPPASRIGRSVATRSNRSRCASSTSPPHARAVGAVAGAVVGDADHRPVQRVLGHHAGDVRVVMLHADLERLGARQRVARRQVVGMQIVRDHSRRDARGSASGDPRPQRTRRRRRVVEIADVRSGIGAVAQADADRVLQQRAAGQHRRANGGRHADRSRARSRGRAAAGPARRR